MMHSVFGFENPTKSYMFAVTLNFETFKYTFTISFSIS